jgi:hypothetical protein
MKVRHVVIAASAGLISFGALGASQQDAQNDAEQTVRIVRQAQERLRAEGYAATPQGLKEFQQAKGIEASGKLDHQTLAALGVDASGAGGATRPQ